MRSFLLYVAIAVVVIPLVCHAEVEVEAVVAAQCKEPQDRIASYEFSLTLPRELRFLAFQNKTPSPIKAVINAEVFAASTQSELAISFDGMKISSGVTGDDVRTRILINEKRLCSQRDLIAIDYLLAGDDPVTVRVKVRPGATEEFHMTDAGRREVNKRVAQIYSVPLGAMFGPQQTWVDRSEADERALALANLLESLPSAVFEREPLRFLESTNISVLLGAEKVASQRRIELFPQPKPASRRYYSPSDYRSAIADWLDRNRSEKATAIELKRDNDQLMHIFFNVERSTYVVFKCDRAKRQMNVEKVVLSGKQLFEAP